MRVAVERLSKTYRDRNGHEVPALQDIGLTAEPEEFLAILGPSGCGKSTLLGIMAGLLPASSGGVFFEGRREPGQPLTASVFQEFALFPWRTVQGNVEFGIEMKWWVEHGFMKSLLPLKDIVDPSFVEEAIRQLGG